MPRYEVEVIDHVRTIQTVEARTAAEARQRVTNGVRPSGVWRRIIRNVRKLREA